MPRIQLTLSEQDMSLMEDFVLELHAGDIEKTTSQKRNEVISYMLKALPRAHQLVLSHKAERDSLKSQVDQMNEAHDQKIKELTEESRYHEGNWKLVKAQRDRLEEAVKSLRVAIHFLTEDKYYLEEKHLEI